jgi:putative membrane protein
MNSASARRAALAHDVRRARQLYQSTQPLASYAGIQRVFRRLSCGWRRICGRRDVVKPADLEPLDRATHLAVTRTGLALDRSAMAAERTLMAWIRTALAMIGFGFTIGKLGDALSSATVSLFPGRTTDVSGVAYYLVILGTFSLIVAAAQHRIEMAMLTRRGLKRAPSLAFVVAVLLSLLGIFAFTDLVTRL